MEYIKGTKLECDDYNAFVTSGQNYIGTTTQWAEPMEIDGYYYILVHDRYPTTLTTVTELPVVEDNII